MTSVDDVQADMDFLVALRRDLHAHPELGSDEERTSRIVADCLAETGMKVHRGPGGTGVVGTLTVGNGTRAIGLRADMDALAMPETAERSYKSTVAGKMHACGHDGHTTLLLGAARQLAKARYFSGTVHFIFQPAEEGRGGQSGWLMKAFSTFSLRYRLWAADGSRRGAAADKKLVISVYGFAQDEFKEIVYDPFKAICDRRRPHVAIAL